MPMPTIPDAIAALLPILAQILSRWLSSDRLSAGLNALIAGVALILTAVLCVWLAGDFTGSPQASVLVTLAYVVLLMRGDLAVLLQFFEGAASPIAPATKGVAATTAPAPASLSTAMPSTPMVMYPSQQQDRSAADHPTASVEAVQPLMMRPNGLASQPLTRQPFLPPRPLPKRPGNSGG